MKWNQQDVDIDEKRFEENPISLQDLKFGKPIAKGANAVVYTAKLNNQLKEKENRNDSATNDGIVKYPLAVKMMFNYDIQSNAFAILNAMYRETVPARFYYTNNAISNWEIE